MKLTMLLHDLHAEKRWLGKIITALEAAKLAPEVAGPLARCLNNCASRGRVMHLAPQKKAELARLARQVHRAAVRRCPALVRGPRLVRRKACMDTEAAA